MVRASIAAILLALALSLIGCTPSGTLALPLCLLALALAVLR